MPPKKEKEKEKEKEISLDDYFKKDGKDKQVFAYCRVSTKAQTISNQFEEISNYCEELLYDPPQINIFYDHGVSGGIHWRKRKVRELDQTMPENSVLIVCELSRLGRNAVEVMELISRFFLKNITIHDIKNNMVFKNVEDDKDLFKIFFLSMFTQVEKNAIKKRVKTAVNNKKNKRPNKLDIHFTMIKEKAEQGWNPNQIAAELKVNKAQVYKYFRDKGIINNNIKLIIDDSGEIHRRIGKR